MEQIKLIGIGVTLLLLTISLNARAWEIDLSKRRRDVSSAEAKSNSKPTEVDSFDDVLNKVTNNSDRQEMVILHTVKGFVPSSVRLRKGAHYTVHVVNVNEDKKNVSFMLDAFAQNHATYYGKIKTFQMDPNKEGIYTFMCPETSYEGRVIVFAPQGSAPVQRTMSSETK